MRSRRMLGTLTGRRIYVPLLVLAIAIGLLWFATAGRTWLFSWGHSRSVYALRSDAGRLYLERLRSTAVTASPHQGGWWLQFADGARQRIGLMPEDRRLANGYGFHYWTWTYAFKNPSNAFAFSRVAVPYWAMIVLCVAPSVVAWGRGLVLRRRRQRAAAGLCVACGYDLRASAGRCPECGSVSSCATQV